MQFRAGKKKNEIDKQRNKSFPRKTPPARYPLAYAAWSGRGLAVAGTCPACAGNWQIGKLWLKNQASVVTHAIAQFKPDGVTELHYNNLYY